MGWSSKFQGAIRELGLQRHFDLRGWVNLPEKIEALTECEIFLVLSHREGMPNALLEAMAAGRAVVGACRMVWSGFLCEPGDVEDIGQRIVDLRRDSALRTRMGRRARPMTTTNLKFGGLG